MAFGGARADLGGEQRAHARACRCLGRQQVDALLAAPLRVARDGGDDCLAHLARIGAGIEHGAGLGQCVAVVDFDPVGAEGFVHGGPPGQGGWISPSAYREICAMQFRFRFRYCRFGMPKGHQHEIYEKK